MHPLFAKLIGSSALENLRKHLAENHETAQKLQAAAAGATTIQERCNQARAAFLKKPSADALEEWMFSESLRSGAHAVNQQIADHMRTARIEHHIAGKAKVVAAFDEVERLLIERTEQISKEDAKRSEELGMPTSSDAALDLIMRHQQQVSAGRQWIDSDPSQAISAIRPFLN